MTKLTHKQQLFVDYYEGNATEAAIKAGYSKKSAPIIGHENLRKPNIIEALKAREHNSAVYTGHIQSRQERQLFWSDTIIDKNIDISARLKASELLGRSEADFIDTTRLDDVNKMSEKEIEERLKQKLAELSKPLKLLKTG